MIRDRRNRYLFKSTFLEPHWETARSQSGSGDGPQRPIGERTQVPASRDHRDRDHRFGDRELVADALMGAKPEGKHRST